jgi:hypothetical protein
MRSFSEIPDYIPGSELLKKGEIDLRNGLLSEEALLILIGSPRLRDLQFAIHTNVETTKLISQTPPEHLLYKALSERLGDGAHSAYNAMIRRLVSAEGALEKAFKTNQFSAC